jgi:flagellar motor switch protein FliN/FliY
MQFSEFDLSILGEIGNVSVGGAATSLSNFVNKIVTISIPETRILTMSEVKKQFEPDVVYAKIDYSLGFSGSNLMLMKKEDALEFSKIVMKEKLGLDVKEWNDDARNVLNEVFNIMVGNMSSSMSMIFNKHVKIMPPHLYENDMDKENELKEEKLVTVWFDVKIEDALKVRLVKIITIEQSEEMIKMIKGDNNL